MGPVSVANVMCWICNEAFRTQRDLKNHLIARSHERMRVICPWCPLKDGKKEKTLRRMSDLKGHLQEQHSSVNISRLPSDFFTEANGFYLGLYPRDYIKIISPSSFRSEAATIARGEVLRWIRDNKKSEKERERWVRDWGIARQETTKRPFTPEEEFLPDYEESTSEKRAREYSPTRSSMADWGVKHINLTGNAATVDIAGGDNLFRLILQPSIWKEAKIFASLMRRSEQPSYNQHFEAPSSWEDIQQHDSEALLKDLALTAGIPTEMITAIKKARKENFQLKIAEVEKSKPSSSNNDQPPVGHTTKQQETEEHQSLEVRNTQFTREETVHEDDVIKEDAAVDNHPICPSPATFFIMKPDSPTLPITSPERPQPRNDMPQMEMSSAPATPCYHPAVSPIPKSTSEVISSANSCHLSSAYTETQEVTVGPRNVAFELLSSGCMPLFPPAKRDWNGVTVQIPCGNTSITWPPENWQQMSADQRLLQWEFAAMQLQCAKQGGQIVDRLELLAHYNMLALPGSATPSLQPTPVHKMRFYNHDVLRRIAVSSSPTHIDMSILKQLEEASKHRDRTTDDLLRFLKQKKINLRL